MTRPTPFNEDVRWAWVAGLLEGDGCFTVNQGSGVVSAVMTDKDTIDRLHSWTGVGTVRGPYHNANGLNVKPLYHWSTGRKEDVIFVIDKVLPYLLERRAARAAEVRSIAVNQPTRSSDWTHCKHGHEFTEENTYRYQGNRSCRTCRSRRMRDYHERQKATAT